jgi:hypothetical protein
MLLDPEFLGSPVSDTVDSEVIGLRFDADILQRPCQPLACRFPALFGREPGYLAAFASYCRVAAGDSLGHSQLLERDVVKIDRLVTDIFDDRILLAATAGTAVEECHIAGKDFDFAALLTFLFPAAALQSSLYEAAAALVRYCETRSPSGPQATMSM